jgi:hypothetical protein
MKYIRKVYRYFFHDDGHDISLLILAAAAAASGSGIVAAGLWIAHAHAPVATATATAKTAYRTCFESCWAPCSGYVR